jgi:hypothetical protein
MTRDQEAAVGRDLELIDLVEAIGNRRAKASARKQRKAIYSAIREANIADGLDKMTDDELLEALQA